MLDDQPSFTAMVSAFGRAFHVLHEPPPHVFADTLARAFFTELTLAGAGWSVEDHLGPEEIGRRFLSRRADGYTPLEHAWLVQASRPHATAIGGGPLQQPRAK